MQLYGSITLCHTEIVIVEGERRSLDGSFIRKLVHWVQEGPKVSCKIQNVIYPEQ